MSTGKAVCHFLAGACMFCILDLDLPGYIHYAFDYDDLYTGHGVQGCAKLFDLVTGIDYMHCVLLGVTKILTVSWIQKGKRLLYWR